MEALANGAVPVVTATSGVREDITDGENGYIVQIQVAALEQHRDILMTMGEKAHDSICPKCRMQDHLWFWNEILDKNIEVVCKRCPEI